MVFDELSFLFPEIFLILSTFFIVIWGLLKNSLKEKGAQTLVKMSLLILICTLVLVLLDGRSAVFFSGTLRTNVAIRFFKSLLLLSTIGVLSTSLISWPIKRQALIEYPILIFMSVFGGMIAMSANDFLILFLGLELGALPLYVLVVFYQQSQLSAEAGLKYFTLGALASGLFLFGVSLIYGASGTIHLQTLQSTLSASGAIWGAGGGTLSLNLMVGAVFVISGLCFKLSLVPFHMWAPDVYQGTSTPIALFLATCVKIIGISIFVRLFWGPFQSLKPVLEPLLMTFIILSMVVGALGGLFQQNLKRLLAYSGMTHMGFILTGVMIGGSSGLQALMIYLILYIPMVLLAFILIMVFKNGEEWGGFQISELRGLATASPLFAGAMALLMFSLAGIPPLAGFFGKFAILTSILEQKNVGLAIVAVLSTLVSGFYYLRIIKVMYFETQKNCEPIDLFKGLSATNRNLILCLCLLLIGAGICLPFLTPLLENLSL